MPTFDQLPAEQRAIIELVVQRGRSYDQLADALQITPKRVRELAHDALVELSPRTAERVDPDRRGQIADYVLNQQSNAERTATRTHLKRRDACGLGILSTPRAVQQMTGGGGRPGVPAPGPGGEKPARAGGGARAPAPGARARAPGRPRADP